MSKQVYVYGDYLMHHGIKGQEWGVQNGPPYPLDKKDRSISEKKANPGDSNKDSDANDDKSLEKKYGVTIERTNHRFGDDYEYQAASVKKTNVKSGQATVNGKDASKALEDKDYSAMDDVDNIGCKALQIYSKNGMPDTLKYLNDNLKNVNYSVQFFNEKYDSGEEYPMFQLAIIDSNKNGYSTYGEFDYTDDQFFFTDDVKLKHFNMGDYTYLMHHGIKGQEWGVQNGPPYPLNPAKDYSKEEQKANAKTLMKEYNTIAQPQISFRKGNYRFYADNLYVGNRTNKLLRKDIKNIKDTFYKQLNDSAHEVTTQYTNHNTKKMNEALDKYFEIRDDYNKSIDNIVNNLVGEYGNIPIKMSDKQRDLSTIIANTIHVNVADNKWNGIPISVFDYQIIDRLEEQRTGHKSAAFKR